MSVVLTEEAREVARAEAQAVLAAVRDEERRARLADLLAAVDEGEVEGDDAQALGELLELGLQTGRVRALYGPDGEQAAIATLRKLPRGRERSESAAAVSKALQELVGRTLHGVTLSAVGPGAFAVSIDAGGVETSVRLDRNGARIASVGT